MVSKYLDLKKPPSSTLLRKVSFDITHRCNNNCRHCWLSLPFDSGEKKKEITLHEIEKLVIEARALGCLRWQISGGEPLIRKDFPEILNIIKKYSRSYQLFTNATLITPRIAGSLKDNGEKFISLYGATAEVHDSITRRSGSFAEMMRGLNYLKEAGVKFYVQVTPLRDNYHQLKEMMELAGSLSKLHHIGLSWVVAPAYDDAKRIKEVLSQRLQPRDMSQANKKNTISYYLQKSDIYTGNKKQNKLYGEDFFSCSCGNNEVHVDPYCTASLCNTIIEKRLRYDLRKGNIKEYLYKFAPSLPRKVKPDKKYLKNCGSCNMKKFCCWCPARAYLEHRDYSDKINYLCQLGTENKKMWDEWQGEHRRYFNVGGINICVDSEVSFENSTFNNKFDSFRIDKPGNTDINIRHYFSQGGILKKQQEFIEVYRKAPWIIYKKNGQLIYKNFPAGDENSSEYMALVSNGHKDIRIFHRSDTVFKKGNLQSLSLFTTDQIILAQVLAENKGLILHSCGVIIGGKGYVFIGPSGAGKSTISKLLKGKSELLCDDRTIVRLDKGRFRAYGTWSHGEIPEVSSNSAYLQAMVFLKKSQKNRLVRIKDKKEVFYSVLPRIVKPLLSKEWRELTISITERLAGSIPAYELFFNKEADIASMLKKISK